MMPTKKLLTAVVAGLLTAACGVGGASTIAHQGTLRIGVKFDQPSIGLRDAHGNFTGFDVDVATYVAKKLGA
ncbi:MAG: extracellular solute-binding protein family 3, partial [Actinomycetia bacterium]|nr:extracellular solute-binding protein family 3 [Actinomycetes bacterium]